jgi:septal ring factor EnvC (AmiA/AmiB activator)
MTALKIFIASILLLAVTSCYAEEKKNDTPEVVDITFLSSKMTDVETRLSKLEEEVKSLREEMGKISEFTANMAKILRNLELATQSAATLRPDIETWESVKKGMAAEDVQELLGNPEEITQLLRGGEVWYYYGLGSITFDRSGRVGLQKTFKELPIENKVR